MLRKVGTLLRSPFVGRALRMLVGSLLVGMFARPLWSQEFVLERYAAPGLGGSMEFCDIDGDGSIDLLDGISGDAGVLVGHNDRGITDLAFDAPVIYDDSLGFNSSTALVSGDLDADGDPDLVVWFGLYGGIGWHENLDGKGSLGALQDVDLAATSAQRAILFDVDSDGDLDIVAILDGSLTLLWFENTTGLGDFGPARAIDTTLSEFTTVRYADVDGDGDPDLLACDRSASQIFWYDNADGLGAFGQKQVIADGTLAVTDIVGADVDGDGDLDVLATVGGKDEVNWYRNVDGKGNFGAQIKVSSELQDPYRIEVADLDLDGDPDVLVASFFEGVYAWFENLDGTDVFGPKQVLASNFFFASNLNLNDLDGDGDLDIAIARSGGSVLSWLENQDGLGSYAAAVQIAPVIESPLGVDTADFDGDGFLDLVSVASSTAFSNLSWLGNPGSLGNYWRNHPIATAPVATSNVRAADLDGDGDADLVSSSTTFDRLSWLANLDGAGTFGPEVLINASTSKVSEIVPADINLDGSLDLLVTASGDDEIAWYENTDGFGSFASKDVLTSSVLGVATSEPADLDGDGDLDVAYVSINTDTVAWFPNLDGRGSFGGQEIISSVFDDPVVFDLDDLDGDGDIDLVVSAYGGEMVWFANLDGLGNFGTMQSIPTQGSSADALFASDLDHDGDLDLVQIVGTSTSYWFQNLDGKGLFAEQALSVPIGYTTGSLLADLDGDGQEDLIAVSLSNDSLAVYASTECSTDPIGSFNINVFSGQAPLSVAFTNTSTGSGSLSWAWDFGDGSSSSTQDPVHIYAQNGTYDVSLTVTGSAGSCTASKLDLIHVGSCGPDPSADFQVSPLTGSAPLTVQFSDTSSGSDLDRWTWDFGDGGFSFLQSPAHTYYNPGSFDVTLTVEGSLGTCEETKKDIVIVTTDGIASATQRNGSGVNPLVLTSLTDPILGTTWSAEVDGTGLGATGATILFGFDRPLDGIVFSLGELLVDSTSSLFFTDLAFVISGQSIHSIAVPGDTALEGLTVYTQALITSVGDLTNALDLVLGN